MPGPARVEWISCIAWRPRCLAGLGLETRCFIGIYFIFIQEIKSHFTCRHSYLFFLLQILILVATIL